MKNCSILSTGTLVLCFLLAAALCGKGFAQNKGHRLPGSSIASYQLQIDTLKTALTVAYVTLKPHDCKTFTVPDTKLVSPPQNPVRNNKGILIHGVWQEEWTIKMCGKTALVPITFIPDEKGEATYVIHPKEIKVLK